MYMEANERQRTLIKSLICNADTAQVLELHNAYCVDNNSYENRIWDMCELDDLFCNCTATEVLDKLSPGFNHCEDYFCETIYGLESFSDVHEFINASVLADYLIKNGDVADILSDNEDEIICKFRECLKDELKNYDIDMTDFNEWCEYNLDEYDSVICSWGELIEETIDQYTSDLED